MPNIKSNIGLFSALYFLNWTRKQSKKMPPEHVALIRELVRKEIRDRIPKPEKYPEVYDYLVKAFGPQDGKG